MPIDKTKPAHHAHGDAQSDQIQLAPIAPTADGISLAGYAPVQPGGLATVVFDSTFDTPSGYYPLAQSSDPANAQSFTTDGASSYISEIELNLAHVGGNLGTVSLTLWSSSVGPTPGLLSDLGVIGTVSDSSLTGSPSLVAIIPTVDPTLTANTRYWIEVTSTSNGDEWAQTVSTAGTEVAAEFFSQYGSVYPDNQTGGGNGAFLMQVTTNPPCYAEGTAILTDHGEVAVEHLRVGDRVMALRRGRFAELRWIGHRTVQPRRHPAPEKVNPVRIRAHAFAPGAPHRDLVVSPDHALYIDGDLVPARHLINGATIVQESPDRVTYYHIELDAHDVVIAEGLAAETYLDTGNRAGFANGADAVTAHPEFGRDPFRGLACAPTLHDAADLAPLRRRLDIRAAALGCDVRVAA